MKTWTCTAPKTYTSNCQTFVILDEGTKFGLYRKTAIGGMILITRCASVDLLLKIADKCE